MTHQDMTTGGRGVNWSLAGLFTAAQAFQLCLLPVWLLPLDRAYGWLLVLPLLITNNWWAFIHEAIHGTMFPDRGINRLAGRVQAILYGAAFDLLRWGHLLHHGLSRTERERSEVYAQGRDRPACFALAYYFRLLGGLYLFEVLGSVLLLLPGRWLRGLGARLDSPCNLVGPLVDKLLERTILRAARLDTAAILVLYAVAFLLYGDHGWMLVLALAGRGLLISLVDNVFHYGTPLDDTRYARNLELPSWAAGLFLHFNLHGAHHLKPALPWQALPGFHRASGAGFQGGFLQAVVSQFRGPIPDHLLSSTDRGASRC
jgi:fatty acid desaturase